MRLNSLIMSCLGVVFLGACSPAPSNNQRDGGSIPASAAVCADGVELASFDVEPALDVVGEAANVMVQAGDYAYIVESLDNTISRLNLQTGALEPGFIDVGNDRGPYDMFADPETMRGWVANYQSSSVSIVDLQTGAVIEELTGDAFDGPNGVTATRTHVYIGNTQPLPGGGYGPGSITVIDRATRGVLGQLPTAAPNPQFLGVIERGGAEQVVVVNSGKIAREGGIFTQVSDAAVELWVPGEDPLAPTRRTWILPQPAPGSRVGAPGRPLASPDGSKVYMTSATAPVVFSVDLDAGEWARGADDPIELYESDADTLHNGFMGDDGLLWVVSFNDDSLYVVDTACDEVLLGGVDLGVIPGELEGPIGFVVASREPLSAYYMTSISKRLGKIEEHSP